MSDNNTEDELKPLGMKCTDADCDNELHCFKFKSRQMSEAERGHCRYCGANLINWDRVHQRNLYDAEFTLNSLRYEKARHHYWHKTIDLRAENHARRKGRLELKKAVRRRLHKAVGTAQPTYDGRQTPKEGNIIFYAQHALACCCRTCMQYWHSIPKGVELTDEQIEYFVELVMMYINERMPNLTEMGEDIPRLKSQTQRS